MSDRELLEGAAKAAEYLGDEWMRLRYDKGTWNPLTDDGDALRLAVKLGIHTKPVKGADGGKCVCAGYAVNEIRMDYLHESVGGDPYAATRRAIVRAAAEIGRNMK